MSPDATTDAAGNSGRFITTRWSLILSSIDGEGEEGKAREALAQLCRIYWRPIFAFVCRQRSLGSRCAGSDSGFFCHGLER